MGEMGKRNKFHNLVFFFLHNILHRSQDVYKIWRLALTAGEKSVVDIYKQENWTNKGNYKQEDADSLLHNNK